MITIYRCSKRFVDYIFLNCSNQKYTQTYLEKLSKHIIKVHEEPIDKTNLKSVNNM